MSLYRAYIFDLDGTVYRGSEALPYAVETIAELRRRGAIVQFLTNNSSQTRAFFAGKLRAMGFGCEDREVHSTASGTAEWLAHNRVQSAFVVGMPGLVQTLREAGILIVNATSKGEVVPTGDEAESVVAGICQTFTYDLMNGAMQQILAGAKFIGTNPDPTYPMEGNKLIPGAGSIVAAVRACSGVEPLIIGKPNPTMINMVIEDLGLEPSDVLVVGDRQDTDIESGRRAGCPTHLVLTGVTTVPPNGQAYSLDLRGLLDE